MLNRNNPIWSFMAKILKDNDIIQDSYNNILLFFNKKKFLREVEYRSHLPIFEIGRLSENLPFCPIERIADTNFYGHANAIKKYAGVPKQFYSIEHGLYFDQYIMPATYWKCTKSVITINKERASLLEQKVGKPVVAIGPYIHYTDSLLDERTINEIKSKYGKTLLFFPSHSEVENKSRYDIKKLITDVEIFASKNNFNSIFCNLFYHDILHSGYKELYEKAGFEVVTAGHRYDLNFIARLKSLILISDMTVGNSVGTHIGYSIYMKRPHLIIDDCRIENSKSNQYKNIYNEFSIYGKEITSEQLRIASYYWGFDCIKSKEEMALILSEKY